MYFKFNMFILIAITNSCGARVSTSGIGLLEQIKENKIVRYSDNVSEYSMETRGAAATISCGVG